MKRLAAMLALLVGCPSTIYNHPFAAPAAINTAVVVSAGVCTVECGPGDARGISEGVLIGELALSSMAALVAIEAIIGYAERP